MNLSLTNRFNAIFHN